MSSERGILNIHNTLIWKWFSSVRLTIFLFGLLAMGACIGTFFPQGISDARAIEIYGSQLSKILKLLGFFDLYHSWWFLSLFILLSMNLIVCSLNRLPSTIRIVKKMERPFTDEMLQNFPIYGSFKINGPIEKVKEIVIESFKKGFGNPNVIENGDETHIHWERGKISRFGPYIIHGSVIFILIGALIGFGWGFRGHMQIGEGGVEKVVHIRGEKGERELDFMIRCDRFTVSFYMDGTPMDYRSDVSIIENGRPVFRKAIRVNHPLRYKGVSFYQADYGLNGIDFVEVRVRKRGSPIAKNLRVNMGEKVSLGEGGKQFEVIRYVHDLQGLGPAVLIGLSKGEKEREIFWVFKRFPGFDESHRKGEEVFELTEVKERYWTGLEVTHDPGQGFVWIGCSIMIIGLFISFVLSHKKVAILLRRRGDVNEILIGGRATKNQPLTHRRIKRWVETVSSGRSE
jgi:cytochrome c biogenesis protein